MSGSFCAIGECMVELAPADAAGVYRKTFAGDTFNTAWYMRKLMPDAVPIRYFTAIGKDAISQQMLSFMEESRLDTSLVTKLDGRTVGLYMIHLEKGERSFSYWRGQSAARHMIAALEGEVDQLPGTPGAGDLLHVSGITLAILPPADRLRLLHMLQTARSAGALVCLDPNMRPSLWGRDDPMRDAIMAAARVADIVLPSFDEEQAVFGAIDMAEVGARYQTAGAEIVVVKNGDKPGLIMGRDRTRSFQPVEVSEVVDTTAAGDSFNAGFLAALMQGENLDNSAAHGAHIAAKVVQGRGALVKLA